MSEREYFNKLIKLLSGGGTLVLRQLLEKYSAPLSFVDYVYTNQATVLGLQFFENQRQLVVNREIAKMDITLLGKLVKGLFHNKMTATERTSVNNIKEERDHFMHSDILKEAKIEEHVFNRRWRTISSILLDAAVEIGPNEFKTEVETFIQETQESAPQGNEIYEILITWCESNEQLAEQVRELNEQLAEQVCESKEQLVEKVHESKEQLAEQVRESNVQLVENIHESKEQLAEQVRESNVQLAEKIHESKKQLVVKVRESKEQLVEQVRESKEQLVKKVHESKEHLVETVHESKEQLVEKVNESKEQLVEKVNESKVQLVEKVHESKEHLVEKVDEWKEQLAEKVRESKVQLAEKVHESKVQLVEKVHESNEQLVEKVNESKVQLVEKVHESKDQLVEKVHKSKEQLVEKVHESKEQLVEKVNESKEQLAEKVHESKVQLEERIQESNVQLAEKVCNLEMNVQETKDLVRSVAYGPVDSLKEKFQCNYEYNNKLDTKVTDSMAEAIGHLQKEYSVLLYGNPGEGKTFSAFRIVKHLVENNIVTLERCALLSNPNDLSLIKRADIDLILIDDIFGRHNADSNRFSAWETEFPTLQSIVGTRKIRLIMSSRMHIYEQYRKKLDGRDIFSRTTELSSAKLSPKEKREILIQQMEFYKRNVNEVNVDECISHALVGFPLCAQQFACDDLIFSKKTDYFRKPYKYFLEQNIKTLDDQSFIALLFVFYKGNKLQLADLDITIMSKDTQSLLVDIANLRGVEKPTSLIVRETKEKVASMKGSYIKTIDAEVSFFHDTMYEAIAQIHYEEYPAEVIKYCTLDYLSQCVYLEGHKNGEGVTVNEADLTHFVERCSYELTEEVKGWNKARWWRIKTVDDVLDHRIFQHPNCRGELFSHMQRDIKTFEIFLTFFQTALSIPAYSRRYCSKWFSNDTFLKEIMPYLDCSHVHKMDYGCLKCRAKAGLLSEACYYNLKDVHTFLRSNKVPLGMKSFILYNAVMDENIDTDCVTFLTAELVNKDDLSTHDKYFTQAALGVALSNSSPRVVNALNASGLLPSSVICYCAIRIGSHQEIHASLLFQPLLQYNQRQPNVYHVLKRMRLDKGDANITIELITATKNAQEPFQNSDLIIHGIRSMREWAMLARMDRDGKDESSLLLVKDIQAWEAAMSSFMELKMDKNVESEVLKEETALSTSLLLKELIMAGPRFPVTEEQLDIITRRKARDKSWNPENAVICTLALIDEDLSVQPREIWRYMEPSDSAKTRSLFYSYNYGVLYEWTKDKTVC